MLRRSFVRPQIFVPLSLVATQALDTSSATRRIKACERDGDTGGVDAVHERMIGHNARFAAKHPECFESRSPRRTGPDAGVVRHPVYASITLRVHPACIMLCPMSAGFVKIHDAELGAVDLKTPNRGGVIDAQVIGSVHWQIGIDINLRDALVALTFCHLFREIGPGHYT